MPSKIHHYSPNLLAKLAIPRNSPFNNSSTIHPPIYLYINRPNQSRQSAPDQSVRQFYLPLPPLYGRATLAIEMGNRLETRMCVCVCVTIAWTNDYSQLHFPPRRRGKGQNTWQSFRDRTIHPGVQIRRKGWQVCIARFFRMTNGEIPPSRVLLFANSLATLHIFPFFISLASSLLLFLPRARFFFFFFSFFFNNIPRVSLAESRFICHEILA